MAVEKEKVLPVLEAKLKGKGFPKTFIDSQAAKLAAKIENEDDIDARVEDVADFLIDADKEADRRATEASKKALEKVKDPGKTEDPKKDDVVDELPADTPAWAKALIEQNKSFEAKLNGFEQEKSRQSLTERFKNHEKLKGLPEALFKGRIPTKEEDFDAAVEEMAADYESLAKDFNVQVFGKDTPGGSSGGKGGKKEASKEEVDAVIDGII